METIRARLREPSTWIGLLLALSHLAPAIQTQDWQAVGSVVAGVLGVIIPERR
jgi:hypothetical protein